ncbi:nucleotide exchange factor GrpE, partial [Candidatus Uhrbacteria bacterium RIFCSPLOWO2_02_FULL_48_12]
MSNVLNNNLSANPSENLEEKVKELERQAEENFAGWQRARADYQNLKKEWEKKQTQFMVEAKKILLAEILPIYDHLKQAMN